MDKKTIQQIGAKETQLSQITRLPLWRSAVETMIKEGITFGKTYSAEYFEAHLKCKRDEMKFGLGISCIRRQLEESGFYLSGRGLKGDSFIILEPRQNQDVMHSYASAAVDALKRGVILGTNTRVDMLDAEDQRRHESILEKLAARLILCTKTKSVMTALGKHSPKTLNLTDKETTSEHHASEMDGSTADDHGQSADNQNQ